MCMFGRREFQKEGKAITKTLIVVGGTGRKPAELEQDKPEETERDKFRQVAWVLRGGIADHV